MKKFGSAVALAALLLAALPPASPAVAAPARDGRGDATVVAVIDSAFSPYHWDFLASKMPQAQNSDPSDDLPLDQPPDRWLPGFTSTSSFASYNALHLSLEQKNAQAPISALGAKDRPMWAGVKASTPKSLNYYWMPGTKVIGAMNFGDPSSHIYGETGEHGMGTTTVSVGNLHGTCPECLLVFLQYSDAASAEAAINWAMSQPWIDAISNSYGFATAYRDRIYSGSNTALQKKASERGQSIFFSAGNGQENAFLIPNTTYFSSEEGPDWIVTVGAISPGKDNYYKPLGTSDHASYDGHGKPADIASIGSDYPSGYDATTVSGTGASGFGGTSNATPTITGIYARGLYIARRALDGPSRVQAGGVVARGRPIHCGSARPKCELGDGKLTVDELRRRLFEGAVHTPNGMTVSSEGAGNLPPVGEDEYANEGHGSYFGLESAKWSNYMKEFKRFVGPMLGTAKTIARPDGERQWMTVDSFCRQHIWGSWAHGYYRDGKTDLPGADPAWPLRSALENACPDLQPLP